LVVLKSSSLANGGLGGCGKPRVTALCESLGVEDRILTTVSEAAGRLGICPNAINRWIAKGAAG
jgi:transposase-like protein